MTYFAWATAANPATFWPHSHYRETFTAGGSLSAFLLAK